jgi:hypothetical protein
LAAMLAPRGIRGGSYSYSSSASTAAAANAQPPSVNIWAPPKPSGN